MDAEINEQYNEIPDEDDVHQKDQAEDEPSSLAQSENGDSPGEFVIGHGEALREMQEETIYSKDGELSYIDENFPGQFGTVLMQNVDISENDTSVHDGEDGDAHEVNCLANTRLWPTVALMLARRRRRRPNVNPFKLEFTIVIFIHYKSRIAVAILDMEWMKMINVGEKLKKIATYW